MGWLPWVIPFTRSRIFCVSLEFINGSFCEAEGIGHAFLFSCGKTYTSGYRSPLSDRGHDLAELHCQDRPQEPDWLDTGSDIPHRWDIWPLEKLDGFYS